MDRRDFLKLGGGLAATATMAEAGMFAEFMSWLKRAPAWYFPSVAKKPLIYQDVLALYADVVRQQDAAFEPLFSEINAVTLENIRKNVIFDNCFRITPFQSVLSKFNGGDKIQESFTYLDAVTMERVNRTIDSSLEKPFTYGSA